jgi:hypothetical protein
VFSALHGPFCAPAALIFRRIFMNPDSVHRPCGGCALGQLTDELADIERAIRVVLKAALEDKLSPLAVQTLRATLEFAEVAAS